MEITQEQVKKTAAMAKLRLSDEEIESLHRLLRELVARSAGISLPEEEASTAEPGEATAAPAPFSRPQPGLRQEEVVALAPAAERGFIRVPRVMDHE